MINCEFSSNKYDDIDEKVTVIDIFDKNSLDDNFINSLIDKYSPEYIIVEYNGTWEVSKILSLNFRKKFEVKNVFSIIDFTNFDIYLKNMKDIMIDKISNADINIITKTKRDDYLNSISDTIFKINKASSIYIFEDLFNSDKEYDFIDKKFTNSDKEILKFFVYILVIFGIIFSIQVIPVPEFSQTISKGFWIFVSLIIQILPFILIGSILSGIIQVAVPKQKLFKIFETSSIKSIFLSLFVGILFPVCDCAMVPVANSIAKKGYSIPVIITFLLAAPAVNPVVIMSTYYAFPQIPQLSVYRIVFGLIIAFLIGILLMIYEKINIKKYGIKKYKEAILKDDLSVSSEVSMWELNDNNKNTNSKLRYIDAILAHCRQEFFKISPYIIVGAFLSTVIQIGVPKDVFFNLNSINILSVFVMIIASIFISICSTSNAFIAKTFSNIMPLNSILAFMVMGPLVDITNLSVLASTFNKKFIFKLLILMIYVSLIIFSLMRGGVGIV